MDLSELHVRPAEARDGELLWRWANDSAVRDNAFSPDTIPLESHLAWFQGKLDSPDSRIYILEWKGRAAGQVRYDRTDDGDAEIDFSVSADHRGLGLGTPALTLTRERALSDLRVGCVVGFVLESNVASQKAFLRAGFGEEDKRHVQGRLSHVYSWPPRAARIGA